MGRAVGSGVVAGGRFWVQDSLGLGFKVWGFRGLGFNKVWGFRGLGFKVWGFRGLGFNKVWGFKV